jgi:aspartyl-tRNA(Asn)/glutamyl-tRNA(Gln) amidotransferase subunit B
VEIRRQEALLRRGGAVEHQTLLWDERRGTVRPMRGKEESHDYRYFPDPDLPPLHVPRERIDELAALLPELPATRRARFREAYGLPHYDAGVLTARRELADYYEEAVSLARDAKEVSNWVMGPVLSAMKESDAEAPGFPVPPEGLAELIGLVAQGRISRNVGKEVLGRMQATGRSAADIVEAEGLAQVSDVDELERWARDAVAAHPEEVRRFREGEERLKGFFMGELMKRSRGKADPRKAARVLERALRG